MATEKTEVKFLIHPDLKKYAAEKKPSAKKDVIEVFGVIGEDVDERFVSWRLREAEGRDVEVHISSPGGSSDIGVAIYGLLKNYEGKKHVKVFGMAASASSVIAMAGDTIEMSEGSQMMIHQSWGLVVGCSDDMLEAADLLDRTDKEMQKIYTSRTGLEPEKVREMMSATTYMSVEEAVALGFATGEVSKKETKKEEVLAQSEKVSVKNSLDSAQTKYIIERLTAIEQKLGG